MSGYDLIGDVHGCAQSLKHLLNKLGYRLDNGCYRHPQRTAIFIGDIVDRGNNIRESLQLVRAMVDGNSAQIVIGNHEYNALAYCTKARADSDRNFLREHNERHESQIRETLVQFAAYSEEWQSYLEWFRQLPLFLEFENFRVVHACWDQNLIDQLKQQGVANLSDDKFIHKSAERGCFQWQVVDRLLRGTYLPLPNNEVMLSQDGYRRHVYRTKFWSLNPETHQDVVFQPDPLPAHIAGMELTEREKARLLHYGEEQLPLFIGHYWQEGRPVPIRGNIACLDYSAVKNGALVAYRMDQEKQLDPNKYVWVDVDPADVTPLGD
ncbi:MAG: metallophosphoesterase [Motiliproteus sp.]|nr:metallophosphoesterase [Motiliproteus sp.]MCW9052048.1 metallophosphoesterase [Motiliproteus sp.]